MRHGPHRHDACLGTGGIAPDIQAIAKGLGGGYQPIGAMLDQAERIIDALRQGSGAFMHGHTYLAHPLACAAALEVQRVIDDDGCSTNVRELGRYLERRLTERFGNHRHVGDIRGRGLFQAIELVADRATSEPFDPGLKLNQKIKAAAFAGGLACLPGRRHRRRPQRRPRPARAALYLHPDDIDMIVERLGVAVDQALRSINH